MTLYRKIFFLCMFFLVASSIAEPVKQEKDIVYVFSIDDEINGSIARRTTKAFEEAIRMNAAYIIIRVNTYGGLLDAADSIRTRILYSPIPVYVFIDNNAASAGALISIAAERIYMRPGGSIGAATVVDQTGKPVPDKYQSYMRSLMRSTCQAHGKDTIISKEGDTIIRWHRNPDIAQAMVDPKISVDSIDDSTKVLTFTTEEAIQNGFCEGTAESISEVIEKAGIKNFFIHEYNPTFIDKLMFILLHPALRSILLILMLGGLYFEMQSPGIGFALAVALGAAVLYFAPLYLEGLAENWEVLMFVAGLILIILEIFVIPGFGIAGISGIILMIAGLLLSMVDNVIFDYSFTYAFKAMFSSLTIVVFSLFISMLLSIFTFQKLFEKGLLAKLTLKSEQKMEEGFIGIDLLQKQMIGRTGVAATILRPGGKVEIDGRHFDAKSEIGYIDEGESVTVTRDEAGQLYVVKADKKQ